MIGNCQAAGIAAAMRLLLPGSEVTFETVHGIGRRHRRLDDLVGAYRDHDAVFANRLVATFWPGGDFETMSAGMRLLAVPVVIFPAFHPDLVFVGDLSNFSLKRAVRTPIGPQNSALALYGFRLGLDEDETVRLFGRETFRRLGYLDAWEQSVAGLLALGQEAGIELGQEVARWARRGAFMHSLEHPKVFVLADLARLLLRRAGIPFADYEAEAFLRDDLLDQGVWPVYPEVGELYGVAGAYVFSGRPGRRRDPHVVLGLRDFVRASRAAYAAAPPGALACPRVDAWLADAPLRADLVRLARG